MHLHKETSINRTIEPMTLCRLRKEVFVFVNTQGWDAAEMDIEYVDKLTEEKVSLI